MNLYLDASALVKRYVAEDGSNLVIEAMQAADSWTICRIGFVEVGRAVHLAAGRAALRRLRQDWPSFDVVEVDAELSAAAAELAISNELRSLDALHLAAAMLLPGGTALATWDARLHRAARGAGLETLPREL